MFLFAHTPTTKLYPLSLHDALPIYAVLTDIQGNQLTLSDYKGKPVVVNLWATWCPPCIREMPVLDEAQQANQDIHFVFVNQGEDSAEVTHFRSEERRVGKEWRSWRSR